MLLLIFLKFVSFPDRKDSLFNEDIENININSSGSIGLWNGSKCIQTNHNSSVILDKKLDWCSNVAKDPTDKPWIEYSLKNKQMRLSGFSIRNGCCYYSCCCLDDNKLVDGCCCELYSFHLEGSNDRITWKEIIKIERESQLYYCKYKTYEFPLTQPFQYVRLIQDAPSPGCAFCMTINQVELYGNTVDSIFSSFSDDGENNDESVSIIGKIKRDESV